MAEIDSLLRTMFEKEGSDLHLAVGMPPRARISGSIEPIGDKVLTAAMLGRMLSEIVPEKLLRGRIAGFDVWHDLLGVGAGRAGVGVECRRRHGGGYRAVERVVPWAGGGIIGHAHAVVAQRRD